jgi:hypothetical protein
MKIKNFKENNKNTLKILFFNWNMNGMSFEFKFLLSNRQKENFILKLFFLLL